MVNKLTILLLAMLLSMPSVSFAQTDNSCLPPDCYLDGEEPIPPTDPEELKKYLETLKREEELQRMQEPGVLTSPDTQELPTPEELLEDNPWPLELVESHSIRTNEEFQADIDKLVSDNERIQDFEREEGKFSFKYYIDAELFGFIYAKYPVTIEVQLDPEAQDRVKVKHPWYSFMFSHDVEDLDTKIKGGLIPVDEALKTSQPTPDQDIELILSAQLLKATVLVLGTLE